MYTPRSVIRDADLPGEHLHCRSIVDTYMKNYGEYIIHTEKDMAHQFAVSILQNSKFYETGPIDGRYSFIESNCVIMTIEELRAFAIDQYQKGVDSARYFLQR